MSELSRKIIDAVVSGEAQDAMMAFEAAAAEKMLAALDIKRAQVARDMFKEATGVDNEAGLDAMRVQEDDLEEQVQDKTLLKASQNLHKKGDRRQEKRMANVGIKYARDAGKHVPQNGGGKSAKE